MADTLQVALTAASRLLAVAGIDNPALDARLLAGAALGLDRAQLLAQSDRILSADESAKIQALIARRAAREPVARILGSREFWGLPFALNAATLEPRPDSETVIEAALTLNPSPRRILDLGTGTGCLLLALLHEWPTATGLGLDCAPKAVAQAHRNAEQLGLQARASFKINNWAESVTERFDLIVSNPPYIRSSDIQSLMPEVRDYDPLLALDGGEDGLGAYRRLIPDLPRLLSEGGHAIFEVGAGQAAAVESLFRASRFSEVRIDSDLAGHARCLVAKR
jgi:release factor glutamine methyltransferase